MNDCRRRANTTPTSKPPELNETALLRIRFFFPFSIPHHRTSPGGSAAARPHAEVGRGCPRHCRARLRQPLSVGRNSTGPTTCASIQPCWPGGALWGHAAPEPAAVHGPAPSNLTCQHDETLWRRAQKFGATFRFSRPCCHDNCTVLTGSAGGWVASSSQVKRVFSPSCAAYLAAKCGVSAAH